MGRPGSYPVAVYELVQVLASAGAGDRRLEDVPVQRQPEFQEREDHVPAPFQHALGLLEIPEGVLVEQMREDREKADKVSSAVIARDACPIGGKEFPVGPL